MAGTIIAITGGIGAGKSMVSKILRAMGFTVYDCDSNAKRIMDNDSGIHCRLSHEISPEVINPDGTINRGQLANIVFSNPDKRRILNSIVHKAVFDDILASASASTAHCFFVESAILYSSGLWKYVQQIWEVTADTETRISRVIKRNGFTRDQIIQRINSQQGETPPADCAIKPQIILNNDGDALIPQIWELCASMYGNTNTK